MRPYSRTLCLLLNASRLPLLFPALHFCAAAPEGLVAPRFSPRPWRARLLRPSRIRRSEATSHTLQPFTPASSGHRPLRFPATTCRGPEVIPLLRGQAGQPGSILVKTHGSCERVSPPRPADYWSSQRCDGRRL